MLFKHSIDSDRLRNADPAVFTLNIAKFMRENIFPYPFLVTISSNDILNFVLAVDFAFGKRAKLAFGYDIYFQGRESLIEIDSGTTPISDLDIEKSLDQHSHQHKFFADISYSLDLDKWSAAAGIGGDLTFMNYNIGRDWTIYIKLSASF
jgi:hypothetical protein